MYLENLSRGLHALNHVVEDIKLVSGAWIRLRLLLGYIIDAASNAWVEGGANAEGSTANEHCAIVVPGSPDEQCLADRRAGARHMCGLISAPSFAGIVVHTATRVCDTAVALHLP